MDRVAENLKVRLVLSVRLSSTTALAKGQGSFACSLARALPRCKGYAAYCTFQVVHSLNLLPNWIKGGSSP